MEIWKDIKGYEGLYQVSNIGRIMSLRRYVLHNYGGLREVPERILRPGTDSNGYQLVALYSDGIRRSIKVHRLVATAFLHNPNNKPEVNHKNGIKSDNTVGNLEWATRIENNQHALDIGLRKMPKGKNHHWYGRSVKGGESHISKMVMDTESGKVYGCAKEAAKSTPYCYSYISGMLSGRYENKTNLRYL